MKTDDKTLSPDKLEEIDKKVISHFWDSELIIREKDRPIYRIFPPEQKDLLLAQTLNITISNQLIEPVVIHQINPEE